MTIPGGARVYTNEAGEPTGYDLTSYYEPEYCDEHGISYFGDCPACISDFDPDEDTGEYDEDDTPD